MPGLTSGVRALIAVGLATLVVLLAYQLPFGIEEEPIRLPEDIGDKKEVVLNAGESARRSLKVSDQPITGVLFFVDGELFPGGSATINVWQGDELLAIGRLARSYYRNTSVHLVFDLPTFALARPAVVDFVVTRESGESLRLKASGESGALTMSLLHPEPLPFGVRQGVIAAAALLAGAALISVIPRRRIVLALLLMVLVVPLALAGFLYPVGVWGISDWDYYLAVHEAYSRSFLEYGEFPFWNPYICGGTAGLADPEFSVFSPLYPLELLFGVSAGMRLAVVVSTFIGATGMILLSRRLRLSYVASLLTSVVFGFSTTTLLKLVEGQVDMFAAMWLPWVLWAWLIAYRSRRSPWAFVCGIFLALMFYQGGIHILLYLGPALLVLSLLVSDRRRGLLVVTQAGLWALGLASLKLVPALLWTQQFPDEAYAVSAFTLPWLYEIFLGRHLHGADVIPAQGGGWHEYGAYAGPIVVALSVLSFAAWRRSRVARGIFIGVVLAVFVSSLGPLLKPMLDEVPWLPRSYTSRAIVLATFGIALLAGFGLDVLRRWSSAGAVRLLAVVLVGLAAIDLLTVAYPLAEQAFVLPDLETSPLAAPAPVAFTRETHKIRIHGVEYDRAAAMARAGYGTLTYCSVLSPPIAVIEQGGEDNAYARLVEGTGSAHLVQWSPNVVAIGTETTEGGTVVINTNFADGWMANGVLAENVGGRVGARVGSGQDQVLFRYRAPGFRLGLVLTLFTLGLAGWRVSKRSRGRRAE